MGQGALSYASVLATSQEQEAAAAVLSTLLPSYLAATTMEELGKKRPKKGQKVPAKQVRSLLMQAAKCHVVLEGPRGIGKSLLLQAMPRAGYTVLVAPP